MKIRFKISEYPDPDTDFKNTLAKLQVVAKYDGFYGGGEEDQTIAQHSFEPDVHGSQERQIAQWAAKTIAAMLRPLAPAEDRPKEER